MRAYVDKETCIGCGLCPALCSEIFRMDNDGKAVATNAEIDVTLEDRAKDAEADCPVNAITVK